jgi:DNA-binding IclR family transcriptional regulator
MYNAPILKKAVDIIRLIVYQDRPLGVTEIARALSISKSTTFGVLKSLEEEGLVVKDGNTKKYVTGAGLFELSRRVLRTMDLSLVARPFLEELAEQVDETIFLTVREDDAVKLLDLVEPQKEFKISAPIGARFALTSGVIAKVFLAPLGNDEILRLLSQEGLRQYTENSITDVDAFMAEIEKTRRLGYAVDLEEYLKGMRAVASLIYSGHFPVGAILVLGFTSSLHDGKLPQTISRLKDAAQRISSRLSPHRARNDAAGTAETGSHVAGPASANPAPVSNQ